MLALQQPPFRISEEGWGEFDMNIVLTAAEKGGEHTIVHDLNFQQSQYEAKHPIVRLDLDQVVDGMGVLTNTGADLQKPKASFSRKASGDWSRARRREWAPKRRAPEEKASQ